MKKYIEADRLKQTIADNVYPVQDAFNSRDYGMFWTGGIEKAIDEQPAADVVEVRHGRWVGYNEDKESWLRDDGTPVFLVCSNCGETVLNNGSAHWHYCPNCGATMDKEEE